MKRFKLDKKYIIAGGIGVVSIIGAIAYLQYKKLMDYCLSFKKVKLNQVSLNNINFNLWLNFLNKSKIKFTIVSQKYDVYINDNFVTKLVNNAENIVDPKSTSVVGVNVDINPSDAIKSLGSNVINLVLNLNSLKIKVDMKIKVKIYGIPFNIPYVYEATIEEMRQPSDTVSEC